MRCLVRCTFGRFLLAALQLVMAAEAVHLGKNQFLEKLPRLAHIVCQDV
jgi:hypothetical protein